MYEFERVDGGADKGSSKRSPRLADKGSGVQIPSAPPKTAHKANEPRGFPQGSLRWYLRRYSWMISMALMRGFSSAPCDRTKLRVPSATSAAFTRTVTTPPI